MNLIPQDPAKRLLASLLAKRVAESIGEQCPECGSESAEDNGSTEYRCVECDHRWGLDGGPRGEPYGF